MKPQLNYEKEYFECKVLHRKSISERTDQCLHAIQRVTYEYVSKRYDNCLAGNSWCCWCRRHLTINTRTSGQLHMVRFIVFFETKMQLSQRNTFVRRIVKVVLCTKSVQVWTWSRMRNDWQHSAGRHTHSHRHRHTQFTQIGGVCLLSNCC